MKAFQRVVAATDFSEPANQAVRLAVDLAAACRCELTLVHVCETHSYAHYAAMSESLQTMEVEARRRLSAAIAAARDEVSGARAVLRFGAARAEILAAIEFAQPDLVVMGTHGRHGLGHALLGSVAESLVRLSPVPVLTIRERTPAREAFRLAHVAAALDFGDESSAVLALAQSVAKSFSARLTLLHVCELPEYVHYAPSLANVAESFAPVERAAQERLDALLPAVRAELGDVHGIVRGGAPVREILGFLEERAPDLLVIGTRGRRGPGPLGLGSVARRIIEAAHVPILNAKI